VTHDVPDVATRCSERWALQWPDRRAIPEVRFYDVDGPTAGGVIVSKRGSKQPTCLFQVKTTRAPRRDDELVTSVESPSGADVDVGLTISNLITSLGRFVGIWRK